jgi:hypothetical protein
MSRRVVDDATRSPIAGATVTVESWLGRNPVWGPRLPALAENFWDRHLLKVIDVRTDAQGFWDVSQEGMWMPALDIANDVTTVWWSYCVRADGYSPLVVDPWKLWSKGRFDDKTFFDDMISDVALHAATGVVDKPAPTLSKCGLPLGPPLRDADLRP